jgi:hypothetical protein
MPGMRRGEFKVIMDKLRVKVNDFVETGTWKGATVLEAMASDVFERIKSIEYDRNLFLATAAKLLGEPLNISAEVPIIQATASVPWLETGRNKVTLYCGDSAAVLPRISENQPTFFYLDAHYWSVLDDTTKNVPLPLWAELDYIRSRRRREIVVVDDTQAFGGVDERTIQKDWYNVTVSNILDRMGNVLYWYVDAKRLIMRTEER